MESKPILSKIAKNTKKRKFEQISVTEEEKGEHVSIQKPAKRLNKADNLNNADSKQLDKKIIQQQEPEEEKKSGKMKRIILWLRNDLRLHDNYVLDWAVKYGGKSKEVLPVYSFDPRFMTDKVAKYGTQKCGTIRARFLLESVACMRHNLQSLGSNLLVTLEKPEVFLPKLIRPDAENALVYQQEICSEELAVEKAVREAMGKGVQIESIWGSTIYHKDDLSFKAEELPHIYGKFREKSEGTRVRALVPTPSKGDLPFPAKPDKLIQESSHFLPDLAKDLGYPKSEVEAPVDKRACYVFKGGEDEGLKRCKEYIWDSRAVGSYAVTRNQLIGSNYSSKLSPWFACGALSPRYAYFETKCFEEKHRKNDSTKVFIDELFWRDFNRFWCIKYGTKVFHSYGIYDRTYYNWQTNPDTVKRWREGRTGMPIIDALIRDLNATGFMPNRGRMVTACYLTMDLKQHWLQGAYHFEEKLIDHDVQSNYGGWSFSAGIGPGRVLVFNTTKQSRDFDKNGDYIKMWVPELKKVPVEYIHEPWTMPKQLQQGIKTIIGVDYPEPIPCEKYTNPNKKAKSAR